MLRMIVLILIFWVDVFLDLMAQVSEFQLSGVCLQILVPAFWRFEIWVRVSLFVSLRFVFLLWDWGLTCDIDVRLLTLGLRDLIFEVEIWFAIMRFDSWRWDWVWFLRMRFDFYYEVEIWFVILRFDFLLPDRFFIFDTQSKLLRFDFWKIRFRYLRFNVKSEFLVFDSCVFWYDSVNLSMWLEPPWYGERCFTTPPIEHESTGCVEGALVLGRRIYEVFM